METILVCEDISDWFHIVKRDIDPTNYELFRLRAYELVWCLEGMKNGIAQHRWQVVEPKKVIKQLNVNEVIGNQYLTVKQLMNRM